MGCGCDGAAVVWRDGGCTVSRYTPRELHALRTGLAAGESIHAIAERLGRGSTALAKRAVAEGWMVRKGRVYLDDAQLARIRAEYPDAATAALAAAMGLTTTQVHNAASRMQVQKSDAFHASANSTRIKGGEQSERARNTRFVPGQVPWNKGIKFQSGGRSRETQFKPGRHPSEARNYQPIGTVRLTHDGYAERKVTDDAAVTSSRRWIGIHRLVWIEANGPIPRGHVVGFKAGMRTTEPSDITLDRLECITRIELMQRNTLHNYPKPIAEVMQLRGALNRKLRNRTRKQEEART